VAVEATAEVEAAKVEDLVAVVAADAVTTAAEAANQLAELH